MDKGMVRVVYASICKKCESCIKERVGLLTYAIAEEKYRDKSNNDFNLYYDKRHDALFRQLETSSCITC